MNISIIPEQHPFNMPVESRFSVCEQVLIPWFWEFFQVPNQDAAKAYRASVHILRPFAGLPYDGSCDGTPINLVAFLAAHIFYILFLDLLHIYMIKIKQSKHLEVRWRFR
ncbi:MAG TPA: hypothetical protein V6C52_06625 [Coleofasciculaceae cyanobacterium]